MENRVVSQSDLRRDKQPLLPILSRLSLGFSIYAFQLLGTPILWWRALYPPKIPPVTIKKYNCRPSLPIRIFFPESYDPKTSQAPLPTVYTIHGGGFCLGQTSDDDEWNARFASMHNVLVIGLNYRKAPSYPFPTAVYDLEALLLATYDDESLPIDKKRIAIGGFSAGGSLTLSVCQLPSIREKVRPSAALPIYAVVDKSMPTDVKPTTRYYKPGLAPGIRADPTDFLARFSPMFMWSYINPGQNLKDPLLSSYFAPRDTLPPHIFFVATELDQLAHETWCMASKFAGRPEPPWSTKVGQEQVADKKGELILDDERFAFEHIDEGGKSSVRWLLIPDQLHGFDHLPPSWHGEESLRDAKSKEVAYQKILGEWLHNFVWK
ncbi:alpha/beta-hydrolase [Hypomontagnella submonticulosa]|nr:alpha/beta-hydrolase [Hypomontagnella submonticulosa]